MPLQCVTCMQFSECHRKFLCGDGSSCDNESGVRAVINWGSSAMDINHSIHGSIQIVDEGDINWACVFPIAATKSNNVLNCIEKDNELLLTKQSCCLCHTISNDQLLSNNCYEEHPSALLSWGIGLLQSGQLDLALKLVWTCFADLGLKNRIYEGAY